MKTSSASAAPRRGAAPPPAPKKAAAKPAAPAKKSAKPSKSTPLKAAPRKPAPASKTRSAQPPARKPAAKPKAVKAAPSRPVQGKAAAAKKPVAPPVMKAAPKPAPKPAAVAAPVAPAPAAVAPPPPPPSPPVQVISTPTQPISAPSKEKRPVTDSPAPTPSPVPTHQVNGGGKPIIPPRPMAKAELFVEGDHVVYPTHGVGRVERIAIEEIAGHKLELIHITFEENRMTLRVPVAKARSAGLRKLASRKMFDEALVVLKGRARIKRTMWSRRAQEYEAKINSGDPLAIAEVVRDLHRNAGQPDQSFSERQIYEAAMDRLAAELAALDKTDKTTAATKLADFLKTV